MGTALKTKRRFPILLQRRGREFLSLGAGKRRHIHYLGFFKMSHGTLDVTEINSVADFPDESLKTQLSIRSLFRPSFYYAVKKPVGCMDICL